MKSSINFGDGSYCFPDYNGKIDLRLYNVMRHVYEKHDNRENVDVLTLETLGLPFRHQMLEQMLCRWKTPEEAKEMTQKMSFEEIGSLDHVKNHLNHLLDLRLSVFASLNFSHKNKEKRIENCKKYLMKQREYIRRHDARKRRKSLQEKINRMDHPRKLIEKPRRIKKKQSMESISIHSSKRQLYSEDDPMSQLTLQNQTQLLTLPNLSQSGDKGGTDRIVAPEPFSDVRKRLGKRTTLAVRGKHGIEFYEIKPHQRRMLDYHHFNPEDPSAPHKKGHICIWDCADWSNPLIREALVIIEKALTGMTMYDIETMAYKIRLSDIKKHLGIMSFDSYHRRKKKSVVRRIKSQPFYQKIQDAIMNDSEFTDRLSIVTMDELKRRNRVKKRKKTHQELIRERDNYILKMQKKRIDQLVKEKAEGELYEQYKIEEASKWDWDRYQKAAGIVPNADNEPYDFTSAFMTLEQPLVDRKDFHMERNLLQKVMHRYKAKPKDIDSGRIMMIALVDRQNEEEVLGALVYRVCYPKFAEILLMATNTKYRCIHRDAARRSCSCKGKGVGTLLVDTLKKILPPTVPSILTKADYQSIGFYRSQGFTAPRRLPGSEKLGNEFQLWNNSYRSCGITWRKRHLSDVWESTESVLMEFRAKGIVLPLRSEMKQ